MELNKSELESLRKIASNEEIFSNVDLIDSNPPSVSKELIEKIVKDVSTNLGVDEEGKLYCVKDGKRIYAEDAEIQGVEQVSDYISNFVPEPTFNVNFSSSEDSELQSESQAIYICSILAGVLNKQRFITKRYDALLNTYNFKKMASDNELAEYNNFSSLLKEFKNMNSLIIKVLISACNYRIAEVKKEPIEDFAYLLNTAEITGFEKLVEERRVLLRKLAAALKTEKVASARLALIEEKDRRIEEIYDQNGVLGKFIKIRYLTTDAIAFTVKDTIYDIALTLAKSQFGKQNSEVIIESEAAAYNAKVKAYRRRLMKMYLSGWRASEVARVRKDNTYLVKAKR